MINRIAIESVRARFWSRWKNFQRIL